MFIKDIKTTFPFSKMRSNAAIMMGSSFRGETGFRNTTNNKRDRTTKPSHLSKRSVSLPTDLKNTAVKTQKLFWFIPRQRRRTRRRCPCDKRCPESNDFHGNSASYAEQQIETRRIVYEGRPPLYQGIPEKVALEWITTSSTHSLSESTSSEESEECCHYDDHDVPLLGLEFVESLTEMKI